MKENLIELPTTPIVNDPTIEGENDVIKKGIEKQEGGFAQKLIEAVRNGDIDHTEQIESLLREANLKLTGVESVGDCQEGAEDSLREKIKNIYKDDGETFYLGDGGLSRIVIVKYDKETKVYLSPVSTDDVKKQWELIK